jgi:hypothetical protein
MVQQFHFPVQRSFRRPVRQKNSEELLDEFAREKAQKFQEQDDPG